VSAPQVLTGGPPAAVPHVCISGCRGVRELRRSYTDEGDMLHEPLLQDEGYSDYAAALSSGGNGSGSASGVASSDELRPSTA